MNDREKGFTQGVAWAVAVLYRWYDQNVAESILAESNIPIGDFRKAGVDECDRKILRKVSPTRRQKY